MQTWIQSFLLNLTLFIQPAPSVLRCSSREVSTPACAWNWMRTEIFCHKHLLRLQFAQDQYYQETPPSQKKIAKAMNTHCAICTGIFPGQIADTVDPHGVKVVDSLTAVIFSNDTSLDNKIPAWLWHKNADQRWASHLLTGANWLKAPSVIVTAWGSSCSKSWKPNTSWAGVCGWLQLPSQMSRLDLKLF